MKKVGKRWPANVARHARRQRTFERKVGIWNALPNSRVEEMGHGRVIVFHLVAVGTSGPAMWHIGCRLGLGSSGRDMPSATQLVPEYDMTGCRRPPLPTVLRYTFASLSWHDNRHPHRPRQHLVRDRPLSKARQRIVVTSVCHRSPPTSSRRLCLGQMLHVALHPSPMPLPYSLISSGDMSRSDMGPCGLIGERSSCYRQHRPSTYPLTSSSSGRGSCNNMQH